MAKMKISVEHHLEQEEVKERLENFFNLLKEEYGNSLQNIQENWNGNQLVFSFTGMGMTVDGTMDIKPEEVIVEGTIPLAALPFKNRIESTLRDQLSTLLS